MAKISFNNIDDEVSNSGGNYSNNVEFFTLKNDGDEAIVRFMCDSVDDFEIIACHDVTIDGKYRKVNCLRNPREPLDNCPLCKRGDRVNQRFFIKLLKYEQAPGQDGRTVVTPKACIWERSTGYARTLKSYIDNYGPLSDVICKIIRHGKAGDMQTTYEIVPNLSKVVFKDEVFVKDPTLFGDFESFGTLVMDRTFDEVTHFVVNGSFPARQSQQNSANAEATPRTYEAPVSVPPMSTYAGPATSVAAHGPVTPTETYAPNVATTPAYVQPTPAVDVPVAPTPNAASAPQFGAPVNNGGWGMPADAAVQRPRRY